MIELGSARISGCLPAPFFRVDILDVKIVTVSPLPQSFTGGPWSVIEFYDI